MFPAQPAPSEISSLLFLAVLGPFLMGFEGTMISLTLFVCSEPYESNSVN